MSLHHIMHICAFVCTILCVGVLYMCGTVQRNTHCQCLLCNIAHTDVQYVHVHQCTLELRTSASCSQLPAWALSMTLSTISKRSYICMYSHRKTDRESPISASRVSNVAFLSEVQHDLLRVAFTRCCSPPWSRWGH